MDSYLRRRNGKFSFRRRIPLDVISDFGRTEIIRSLGDSGAGEARRLAYRLWFESEVLIMRVRDLKKHASPAETDAAAKALLDTFEGRLEEEIAAIDPNKKLPLLDEPAAQAAHLKGLAAAATGMAGRNDIGALIAAVTDPGVEDASLRVVARKFVKGLPAVLERAAEDHADLAKFRDAALPLPKFEGQIKADPALIAALRLAIEQDGKLPSEVAERLNGLIFEAMTESTPAVVTQVSGEEEIAPAPILSQDALRPGKKSALVSVLWQKFGEFKVAKKDWKPGEVIDAASTLALFIAICGDREPYLYDRSDASEFLLIFSALPSDYYSRGEYRKIYDAEGPRGVVDHLKGQTYNRISAKTFGKHRGRLHGFFTWAAGDGLAILPENTPSIFGTILIQDKTPKRMRAKRRDEERLYLPEEITKLGTTPLLLGCRSQSKWKVPGKLVFRNERYWLLLLAMHHGNRREEMVLLKVKHIKLQHGVWYFDFLDAELDGKLKDEGSYRELPIHKNILDLGFLQARVEGREPDALLFPEALSLAAVDRQAEPFGKWFLRYRRHHGVDDERLDFHAWRGTVTTGLIDLGQPPSFVEGALGWEGERRASELDTYDKGDRLRLLKTMIDLWRPPLDIEALSRAVEVSDTVDRRAAWPDLIKAESDRAIKKGSP